MNKKGDALVTKYIVIIIILVMGFAIGIFVFYQLGWTGRVNSEVCHQSVVYRATLPSVAGAKEYVPLKCKTKKICITTGIIGGNCEKDFGNSDDVVKIKVKNEEQISRAIAQEIVECWSTMGEGKVSIFSQWLAESYGFGSTYPSCVICSRIAFDEKLAEKGIDFEKINVMDYMMRYKIADKDVTYYDYLVGEEGKVSVGDLFEKDEEAANKKIESSKKERGDEIGDLDLNDFEIEKITNSEELNERGDQLAVMFMQISSPSHKETLINDLKIATAFLGGELVYKSGSFFTTKLLGGASKVSAGKLLTPFVKFVIAAAIIVVGAQQGNVALNRAITAGYCGDVSYGDDAREGCSVVRTINYNPEEISQYCSVIESID